jgi:DDE superfamily endonuclease
MLLAPDDPGAFPPSQRVDVVSIATSKTEDHQQPASRWSLADIATTLINEAHAEAISRATIGRILNEADLKPHRSVYWLNSHDPDFEAKARQICQLYVHAPRFYQQGRLVLCCDEKTGMQILRRNAPTQLIQPGKPAKREYEYTRLGTRALIATFAVPTGEVVWDLGPTRTNTDFLTHVLRVAAHFRELERFDWVVDNLNTHSSLPLCQVMAYLNGVPFVAKELQTLAQRRTFLSNPEHKHVFHYLPLHGSWLNQIELWFSVLSRRFLRRGDFSSVADFEHRLHAYLEEYNLDQAHPYRWTYTGEPLVRGTPFSQTRRQQRHGRAWFGRQPSQFERLLYPPRPYQRRAKQLTANL